MLGLRPNCVLDFRVSIKAQEHTVQWREMCIISKNKNKKSADFMITFTNLGLGTGILRRYDPAVSQIRLEMLVKR